MNRRDHYRLRYPVNMRATVRVRSKDRQLLELSETACRLRGELWKAEERMTVGVMLMGEAHLVRAVVQRHDEGETVLRFLRPLPRSLFLSEQARVIRKVAWLDAV